MDHARRRVKTRMCSAKSMSARFSPSPTRRRPKLAASLLSDCEYLAGYASPWRPLRRAPQGPKLALLGRRLCLRLRRARVSERAAKLGARQIASQGHCAFGRAKRQALIRCSPELGFTLAGG